jgi:hypothetical protein
MSHNKVKVAGKSPSQTGDITVNLTDLDDISGTATTDQYLQYDGSNWSPVDAAAGSNVEFIFIGQGESDAYSNSPHGTGAFSATSALYVYDTSPQNSITGATINKTGDWITSIELPAGKYAVTFQTLLEFSASGYAVYSFYNGTTRLTASGVIGTNRGSYSGAGDLAYGIINLTATTTINPRMTALSNVDTGSNQGNTPSEHGLIIIEKLS